jgi:putative endonuclease
MKIYKVYILKSLKAEKYYIGSTEDVDKRLDVHNSSRAKWTKKFQPWILIYTEDFSTRGEAVTRERFLKSLKNTKKFLDENLIRS